MAAITNNGDGLKQDLLVWCSGVAVAGAAPVGFTVRVITNWGIIAPIEIIVYLGLHLFCCSNYEHHGADFISGLIGLILSSEF